MVYKFIIDPEKDACNRCKRVAYVGGKPGQYNIHVVNSSEENVYLVPATGDLVFPERASEGRTGLLHPHCRCKAKVFEAAQNNGRVVYQKSGKYRRNDAAQKIENIHVETEREDIVKNDHYDNTSPIGETTKLDRGMSQQIRSRYRQQDLQTTKKPGNPFATVISNVVTSLINSIYKLFGKSNGS